jgi:hypothetical protein
MDLCNSRIFDEGWYEMTTEVTRGTSKEDRDVGNLVHRAQNPSALKIIW